MTSFSREPGVGDRLEGSPETGWQAAPAWRVRTTRGARALWRIAEPVWRVVRVRHGEEGVDIVVAPFRG